MQRALHKRCMRAKAPLIVSGTASGSEALMQATANIACALHKKSSKRAGLSLCLPEVNSLGVAMLGGGSLDAALQLLQSGEADGVVVVENDIYRRAR